MAAPFDSGVFDPGAFDAEAGGVSVHLSSPTGVATAGSTASGTVSTDVGNGTLYWRATTNASESIATVKAGSSQAVAATGVQNVLVTGLTPDTQYYLHFTQTTTVPEDAAVVSSAAFTTAGTQLLLSPEAFDNAAWATFSAPTVTANVENDPNGNATVDNVNLGQDLRQHIASLPAGTYTLSAYVKSGPATAATAVRFTTNNTLAWNTGISQKHTLSTTLTLYSTTFTLASTQALAIIIGAVDATAGARDGTITGNFRIAWAMLNEGSVRGDYVPQDVPTVNVSIGATETGSDSASLATIAVAAGALSATESGADTASIQAGATAAVLPSATETGADSASIAAIAPAQCAIAAAEAGQDSLSIAAIAQAQASLSAGEAGADIASVVAAAVNMIVKIVYKDALYTRSAQFGAGFQVAKSASPEYAVQSEKDAGF